MKGSPLLTKIALTMATAVFLFALPAAAALAPIHLDGYFDDWTALTPVHDDSNDDTGVVDFGRIWVANDQDYLYIRFETEGEVQPDEQQNMRLYLDTDLNAGTGRAFGGIGAELVWEFGGRDGTFDKGAANNQTIDQGDLGILIGPTVSNTEFEVALPRDVQPSSGVPLFGGDTVRFLLRDLDSGDLAPSSGSISYTFAAGSDVPPSLLLGRDDPAHIRVATWNVKSDGLFSGGSTEDAQNRILDAVDPDVLVVNEVWNSSASDVRDMVEQHLPSGVGEAWYAVKRDDGNVVVSRYPIVQSWEVNPGYRITAVRLDLGAASDKDLLVLANHWRCCTADYDRQQEADSVIEFLADARSPGGVITLPEDTPLVLCGDLNLVGWRQQLDTIVTGDIQDEGTYGPDAAPDWGGADFAHPAPRHPDGRAGYTWRNDYSSYLPGLLDYIFYTDSILDLHNHFILETRTMTPANLAAHGLQAGDTYVASDHAMRVADFTIFNPASPVHRTPGLPGVRLLPNVPNPFNPSTRILFEMDGPGTAELSVFDARGRLVRRLTRGDYPAGTHQVTWDGSDQQGRPAASGVYQVRLVARHGGDETIVTRPVTLVE
jgi:endonuclease/exonuclease/phosphatase family metal-dependent hydrolase